MGWMVARLAPLVGLAGGESSREELFTAWRRFLEAIATGGPLVIVIEDLHWADEALLAFCDHLLQWVTGVPLMLVGTARPELFDKAPNWGAGHRNATTIGLAPLTDAETAQLVAAMLGTAVLPAATHALLLQRAGGNPLYAAEFIRMITDRGQLPATADPDQAADADALGELFPESVQAIIAARLDTLSPESKGLMSDAAVIGQTFWSGAVATLADRDEASVRIALHELSRRDYLRPARISTLAGQTEYIFGHALIAEVAYAQIPRAARATKHQAAAQWLAGVSGDDPGEQAAVIAHHYSQAHTLSVAAGSNAPGQATLEALADRARHWHTLAAEHAAALDAVAAERHYQSALDLTGADDPQHPHLLTAIADVYRTAAGRYREAEATLERAEIEHLRRGNRAAACIATVRRSKAMRMRGRTADATRLLDHIIDELEQSSPGPELLEAYTARAGSHMVAGRFQQTNDWANTALGLAERLEHPQSDKLFVWALIQRGVSRGWLGDPGGEQDMLEALALATEHNDTGSAIDITGNLGVLRQVTESPAAGLPFYDQALTLARDRGRHGAVPSLEANRAETLAVLGRWTEALDVCERTVRDYPDSESEAMDYLHGIRAGILVLRGEHLTAATLLDRILPAVRAGNLTFSLLSTLIAAIGCAQARLDDTAVRQLTEQMDRVLESDAEVDSCLYLSDVARIMVTAGRTDTVVRMIDAAPQGLLLFDNNVLTAKAVLAESARDLAEAADLYQQAAKAWSRYGHRLEEAQALLGAGRCQARLEQPAEALLVKARAILIELRAQPLLDETERQLRSLRR